MPVQIRDSSSSVRALIIKSLFRKHKKILAVFEDGGSVAETAEDLASFGFVKASVFSAKPEHKIEVLSFLRSGRPGVIITDSGSLGEGVPPPEKLSNNAVLKKGLEISPQRLIKILTDEGFARDKFVYERGVFSLRGSVLDLWDFASRDAVRVRFAASVIESVSRMDISSQLSSAAISEAEIYGRPDGEAKLSDFVAEDFAVLRPDSVEPPCDVAEEFVLSPSGEDSLWRRAPVYNGKIEYFLDDLKNYDKNNFDLKIFCDSIDSRDYLRGVIESKSNLRAVYTQKRISGGAVSWSEKKAFLKAAEILGFGGKMSPEKKTSARKVPRGGLVYRKGDIVVHEDYGIASFVKLSGFSFGGKSVDYITLKYSDATAHVPLEEFSKLHLYRAPRGVRPVLSRLGANDFSEKKNRVYKNVFKMAKTLMETASKRKFTGGMSHLPAPAEREFAGQFPYEETRDQVAAIGRILSEMASPHPMDHLLCGDVGYGKTEVAMRAAFRACWGGYQTICVVPTTVLAQQQYYVFRDRFKNFPVEIEMLSRFTAGKRKTILRNLEKGKTDILIATHAAFSEDVKPAKPGLIIIDEEHRFGVRQKEILKSRYPAVDILMMSATPIPRTLSMALSKIMSFSIIETPPPGRLRIETHLGSFSNKILRKAVGRELARGGGVFYVCNRIAALRGIHDEFRKMFPGVSIAVAHARMKPEKLSSLMMDFANGKYRVLLSTIIIQSGLDIPNVNTLIIRNSQTLGLSQMYQLRGRIGRGSKKAYCYFFYGSGMTAAARKRFEFLQEFENLSSGFRLAMRDLELRGSGNIFGVRQHGYIKDVGSELYFKLLEKAVFDLKGYKPPEKCELRLSPGERFFPPEYVSDADERFRLLIRLSRLNSVSGLDEFTDEIEDRFGLRPKPVDNLLDSVRLRLVAQSKGFSKIEETQEGFVMEKKGKRLFYKGTVSDLIITALSSRTQQMIKSNTA